MSRSGKVSKTYKCFLVFGAAEKNKEKVEANCTGFSAEFFGSQSVEMVCFARKTKIKMLTTSSRSLTRIHQRLIGIHSYQFLVFIVLLYIILMTAENTESFQAHHQ